VRTIKDWIEEARIPQSRLGKGVLPLSMRTALVDDAPLLSSRLKEGLFETEQAEADYAEAFRKYGLDLLALDPETVAERITASSIKEELLTALDDWAALKWTKDRSGRDHLLRIARQVDSDEWRNRFRDLAMQGNRQGLEELAGQADIAKQSPATLSMLGLVLLRLKAYARATAMLQRPLQIEDDRNKQNNFAVARAIPYLLLRDGPHSFKSASTSEFSSASGRWSRPGGGGLLAVIGAAIAGLFRALFGRKKDEGSA
jgi:hypothetical protein